MLDITCSSLPMWANIRLTSPYVSRLAGHLDWLNASSGRGHALIDLIAWPVRIRVDSGSAVVALRLQVTTIQQNLLETQKTKSGPENLG